MKRFNSLIELAQLPFFADTDIYPPTFEVTREERDFYVSLLPYLVQEQLKRTGEDPLFRAVRLVVKE